eukprot:COSAG06_NODE_8030_length_2293_cov_24.732908_4_plen_92_part_00
MSTFTLSRCGEAAVAGLVHHETSKVARRVSCGRPEAWHASRFSAHIASAPLCNLDPEMGSAPGARPIPVPRLHGGGRFEVPKNPATRFKFS